MTTYEAICRTVAALESGLHACACMERQGPAASRHSPQPQPPGAPANVALPVLGPTPPLPSAAAEQMREHEEALLAKLLAPLQLMAAHQVSMALHFCGTANASCIAARSWGLGDRRGGIILICCIYAAPLQAEGHAKMEAEVPWLRRCVLLLRAGLLGSVHS